MMKNKTCDLCGKREAELKVSQVDKDGQTTEIEVCAECARRRGFSEIESIKHDVVQILAEMRKKVADEDAQLVCAACGMSFADFKRQGRIGCGGCYEAFGEKLVPLIRRIQGAAQHVGRSPRGGRKEAQLTVGVQRLGAELQSAIQAEDYERAARLRDALRKAQQDSGA